MKAPVQDRQLIQRNGALHCCTLFGHFAAHTVEVMMCCSFSPTSDGAACAILASEDFVRRHRLQSQAIQIIGQAMRTDFPSTFEEKSCMKVVRFFPIKYLVHCVYFSSLFTIQEYSNVKFPAGIELDFGQDKKSMLFYHSALGCVYI